jgi:hypothetical protein
VVGSGTKGLLANGFMSRLCSCWRPVRVLATTRACRLLGGVLGGYRLEEWGLVKGLQSREGWRRCGRWWRPWVCGRWSCGGEDAAARWGREKTGKKTAGAATVFSLRKKGTTVGLVSCVSGRRCCLGREGERRPEEGRDRLWEQKSQSRGTVLGTKSRGRIVERGSLGRAKGEGS